MSRYFVDDAPVPIFEFDPQTTISEVAPNVIYIKARMDIETKGRVQSEMVQVDSKGQTTIHAGINEMALLIHNIVRWEGPELGAMACIAENIRRLDPREPHIAMVLEEIATRNKDRVSPNPKSNTTTTLKASGLRAVDLAVVGGNGSRSEPMTFTSRLQSALDGRPSRPED